MKKYAEIYGGLVRDLKESNLDYIDFCSIFAPTSYWVDVTGIEDIQIGYLIKFSKELGTYFEAPSPLITEETLETKRSAKLEILKELFSQMSSSAWIDSSLGFRADANDEASRNVQGLITLLETTPESTIEFCDYDNLIQTLNLEQLKTLELEIIKNGSYLYQQKWSFRDAIEEAESEEELDNINIVFNNLSFN